MEGVLLTIGGFTRLTLTPEGTLTDGHGTGSAGDDCTAAAIHDAGGHNHVATGNDPASVPSNTIAKDCTSGPSQGQPNVGVVSMLEEASELAAPEATKPLHSGLSTENGSEAVLSEHSSLIEPSRLASQSSSSLSSSFDVSSSRASAPPPATAAQSDMPQLNKQSADYAGLLDAQAPMAERVVDVANTDIAPKPLQSHPSYASTIVDDSPDNGLFSQEEETLGHVDGSTLHHAQADEKIDHDLAHDNDQEHLPEPPASPTSNTLLSTSSGSTYGESPHQPMTTSPTKGKTPSANRISISYAAGSRRLVVDAEVVEYLRVYRAEGRIEVYMSLDKDGDESMKGVLVCMVLTPGSWRYQQCPGRRALRGH